MLFGILHNIELQLGCFDKATITQKIQLTQLTQQKHVFTVCTVFVEKTLILRLHKTAQLNTNTVRRVFICRE